MPATTRRLIPRTAVPTCSTAASTDAPPPDARRLRLRGGLAACGARAVRRRGGAPAHRAPAQPGGREPAPGRRAAEAARCRHVAGDRPRRAAADLVAARGPYFRNGEDARPA